MKLLTFVITFCAVTLIGYSQGTETRALAWDLSDETDLAAWRVYQRTSTGTWEVIGTVQYTNAQGQQKFVIQNLTREGSVYRLTAVNNKGVEGPASEPVSIPAAPKGLRVEVMVKVEVNP